MGTVPQYDKSPKLTFARSGQRLCRSRQPPPRAGLPEWSRCVPSPKMGMIDGHTLGRPPFERKKAQA
jgi:hypothetical protein